MSNEMRTNASWQSMTILKLLFPFNLIRTAVSKILLPDLSLDQRTNVPLATRDIPPSCGADEDEDKEDACVVHILGRRGAERRQDEDDADEQGPEACPGIDEFRVFAQMPWTRNELAKRQLAQDRNHVGPIESDGADVEDTRNSRIGSQSN